jgi:adenylate kinase family enzyme
MRRVAIIGPGGAGKSTLARQLGTKTGLPVVHLDTHYWRAGWTETPHDEWVPQVEALAQADRWIIDGNYSRTLPVRLARADTVVFLDFARWRYIWQAYKRIFHYYGRTRPDLPEGCPEGFDLEFTVWLWHFPKRSRPEVVALIEQYRSGRRVEILPDPGAVRRFLAEC